MHALTKHLFEKRCISCWHISLNVVRLWLYLNIIMHNFKCLVIWHSRGWFPCKIFQEMERSKDDLFWTCGLAAHISAGHTCHMSASLFFQLFSFLRLTSRQETSLPTSGSEKCLCLHIKQFSFFLAASQCCVLTSVCFLGAVEPYINHTTSKVTENKSVPEKDWHGWKRGVRLLWRAERKYKDHIAANCKL